jgi:acetyl esterase/lipase
LIAAKPLNRRAELPKEIPDVGDRPGNGITIFWLALVLIVTLAAGCAAPVPRNLVHLRNLEYARVNGQPLLLDIYQPSHYEGRLPVLVWIYGGSWNSGSKDPCPVAFMTSRNLAVVSFNYRLSGVARFPAQIYDCKAVIRWLRANAGQYHLDADRIGIFGASAGGHLAALLGTTMGNPAMEGDVGDNLNFSSKVQCVCAFYPPTDLDRLAGTGSARRDPNSTIGQLLGVPVAGHEDAARRASPLTYVTRDAAPFFLMHGDRDTVVPVEQSKLFYAALKQAGVEAQLAIVPGKGHGIIAPPPVAQQIYSFFDRYLRPAADGSRNP